MEIDPDNKLEKALWIHGLAAGPDNTLYYTEKQAVRRIDPRGNVSPVAENIKVPNCTHADDHRGGPILRGLDVAPDGTVYVAAMACQAVIRISPTGNIDVALKAEAPWTPTGIAVKGDEVFVLEFLFGEVERAQDWLPRVRKLAPDGTVKLLATVTNTQTP
jgi:sugar lactone lactonase YvrE